jgi:hypothetical protein
MAFRAELPTETYRGNPTMAGFILVARLVTATGAWKKAEWQPGKMGAK